MKKTLRLVSLQLRARYRLSTSGGAGGQGARRALVFAGLALAAVSLLSMYCAAVGMLFDASIAETHQPDTAMQLIMLAIVSVVAVFGVMLVTGEIFLARDYGLLAPLPVTSGQIFLSKFILLYLREMLVAGVFLFPAVAILLVKTGGAHLVPVLLRSLLVWALLPVFPLLAATVAGALLMLLVSRFRRRDAVITALNFAIFAAVFAGQMSLSSALSSAGGGNLFSGLFEGDSFHKIVTSVPQVVSWAAAAVAGGPWEAGLPLIMLFFTSVLAFIPVFAVTGLIYKKTAASRLESPKGAKKRAAAPVKASSALRAIVTKEWRSLLRTPAYAMNALVGGVIVPIVFIPLAFGSKGEELGKALAALPRGAAPVLLGGVIAFFSSMNMGAFTSVSREGAAFGLLKSLPVPYEEQIKAKLLFGGSLALVWAVPVAVLALFVPGVAVWDAAAALVLGLSASFASAALGLYLDARSPKLSWENETQAIKQNMNALAAMLCSMLAALLLTGLGMLAVTALRSAWPAVLAWLAASAGVFWPFYRLCLSAARRFEGIDA